MSVHETDKIYEQVNQADYEKMGCSVEKEENSYLDEETKENKKEKLRDKSVFADFLKEKDISVFDNDESIDLNEES